MKKRVTVSIPTYNGSKFILDAIKSISDQLYQITEINIIDDNSSDNTIEIVKEYAKEDNRIKIYKNKKNLGYPKNWNKCFEYCKTKYLVILHQDDILKKEAVRILYEFLHSHSDFALAGGYEDFVNESGEIFYRRKSKPTKLYNTGEIYEFVLNHGSYIACSSVMFDMEKIRTVGNFDTDVIATDELYWPKVLSRYPIAVLTESLIYRRSHKGQTEYAHFVEYEKEAIDIYEKFKRIADYEKRIHYRARILKLLRFKFSKGWIGIAANVAKQGYKIIPFKYIGRAIFINPIIIFYFPRMWKTFAKILLFSLGLRFINYMINCLLKKNLKKLYYNIESF